MYMFTSSTLMLLALLSRWASTLHNTAKAWSKVILNGMLTTFLPVNQQLYVYLRSKESNFTAFPVSVSDAAYRIDIINGVVNLDGVIREVPELSRALRRTTH